MRLEFTEVASKLLYNYSDMSRGDVYERIYAALDRLREDVHGGH